jgi:hypothetical protein
MLALTIAAPALAQQTIVNATDPDAILTVARAHGSAVLSDDTMFPDGTGDPTIEVTTSSLTYYVRFRNCNDSHAKCEDLNFYAGFADIKPTLDQINAWNRDWRFGHAYVDADLDAVIEFDLDLEYGTTQDSLEAAFAIWDGLIDKFSDYIGYKS